MDNEEVVDVKGNLNAVIAAMRAEEVAGDRVIFCMHDWINREGFEDPFHCGTSACIGGYVELVCGTFPNEDQEAADAIGIGWEDRCALFYPFDAEDEKSQFHSMNTKRDQAIALLEDIRDGIAVRHGDTYLLPERVRR